MLCLPSLVRRASLLLFLSASSVAWAGITLTPSSVTLAPGASQTFTASEAVTWSLDAGDLSYSDTTATYTATSSGSNLPPGTYALTATSQADTTRTASATITVMYLQRYALGDHPDSPILLDALAGHFKSYPYGERLMWFSM